LPKNAPGLFTEGRLGIVLSSARIWHLTARIATFCVPLPVAGLHRAGPSATLDKITSIIPYVTAQFNRIFAFFAIFPQKFGELPTDAP